MDNSKGNLGCRDGICLATSGICQYPPQHVQNTFYVATQNFSGVRSNLFQPGPSTPCGTSVSVPAINAISIDIRSLEFIRVLAWCPRGINLLPPGRTGGLQAAGMEGENRQLSDDSTLRNFVARGIHSRHTYSVTTCTFIPPTCSRYHREVRVSRSPSPSHLSCPT